jgi:hypothetical protein
VSADRPLIATIIDNRVNIRLTIGSFCLPRGRICRRAESADGAPKKAGDGRAEHRARAAVSFGKGEDADDVPATGRSAQRWPR